MSSVSDGSTVVGRVGRLGAGLLHYQGGDTISRHGAEVTGVKSQRRADHYTGTSDVERRGSEREGRSSKPENNGGVNIGSGSHRAEGYGAETPGRRRSQRQAEDGYSDWRNDAGKMNRQRSVESVELSRDDGRRKQSNRDTHREAHRETHRDTRRDSNLERDPESSSEYSLRKRDSTLNSVEDGRGAYLESDHLSSSHRDSSRGQSRQGDSLSRRRRGREEQRGDGQSEHREARHQSRSRGDNREDFGEAHYGRNSRGQTRRDEKDMHSRERRSSSSVRDEERGEVSRGYRRNRQSVEDFSRLEHRNHDCDRPRGVDETRTLPRNSGHGERRERRISHSSYRDDGGEDDQESLVSYRSTQSRKRSESRQSLLADEDLGNHRGSSSRSRRDSQTSQHGDRHRHADASNGGRRRSQISVYDEGYNGPGAVPDARLENSSLRHRVQSSDRHNKDHSEHTRRRNGNNHSPTHQRRHHSQARSEISSDYRRSSVASASEHNYSRASMPSGQPRSSSPKEEHEAVTISFSKPDINLSRRSSSSRSNHDTGFASSSSSPRRDDSQSRFSDISPSRYGEDDGHRSRHEESGRRHRAKMISNSSLDVPGHVLRKDLSLSSSGRGDSSFEENCTENIPVCEIKKGSEYRYSKNSTLPRESSGNRRSRQDSETSQMTKLTSCDDNRHDGKKPTENLVRSKQISPSTTDISKEQRESPNALSRVDVSESASSSSTLRGATGNFASKASIAGSISSLLGRATKDQTGRTSTSEETPVATSVADKWRRLKQGIIPDSGSPSTLSSGKESAASIISAAAARLMSSMPPIVQNTFPRRMSQTNGASMGEKTTPGKISEPSTSPRNESNTLPKNEIKPSMTTSDRLSNIKNDATSSQASLATSVQQPKSSQRPSVISTLSNHNKRADAYAVMTEEKDSPESEESGEMTPPPLDTEMKRRSKEVDAELTSFLPAEMSKREEKFHDAARVNDAAALRTLLKERVNVNCRNSLDRTALHWAAANGNLDAVEVLIEAKTDLEAKDKYGMRAILWSAWFGHIPVLRALVNAGASTRVANKQGLGVLHCAAENNHVAVISFIFEALEPHDVNLRDKNERTPLHAAAEGGHAEAVNRLLQAKADLHKKDKGGMTAVHLASKQGHIDALKALLLQGVEVDDRDVVSSLCHILIKLLLDNFQKEVTPLHLAAQEGHVDVCKSLVKYGCNVNAQNFQGNTALHLAANGNHKEVARVLVDAKCELDLSNSRLQTPLHVAVECGHLDVVQILLAGGASMDTREKSGKSALQLAARGNYVAVVDMLIKAERYYATARDYHDKDVGYVDPDSYLRKAQHPNAPQMKDVLWKLATKQLKPTDWKKLAYHWQFTPEHVRAIEQEYTGTTSYKEHSFRLLNIWLHGIRKDENVLKLLFEALTAIERKQLAESVRRKVNLQSEKPCSPTICLLS
ncbi:NK-tumor recognition protein [Aplysia californica]|uniref:NK-tumor recognition protein n=1 Tax=Aplysia californica TaxID=6500 RepID=A0ABM1W2N1_APLCA|nr:NK-tumor recognition protein [Aplysia californica]